MTDLERVCGFGQTATYKPRNQMKNYQFTETELIELCHISYECGMNNVSKNSFQTILYNDINEVKEAKR